MTKSITLNACRLAAYGFTACLGLIALADPDTARADVNAFTLRQPLNNATVRETVPIRVPRNLLNQAGYMTITIDGKFLGAPAVPVSGDTVYEWDTKHVADASPGGSSAGSQQESPDGKHTVQVSLFDKDSNEIASATSVVRVLNLITTLPDGVRLIYKWRPDEVLTYRLHSVLKRGSDSNDPSENSSSTTTPSSAPVAVQDVYARLQRSVEDISSVGILVRDRYTGGTYGSTSLTQAFPLASKYTTVNKSGDVLVQNQPLGAGKHYGYGFDSFPDRRVNAGDSWQTQIMISLPWATEKMTTVRGQGRLDDFEWQDGYPTAKIVESYTGAATFSLESNEQSSPFGGLGGSTAAANSLSAGNVTVKKTIWFAYEAGAVVREETTLTVAGTGIPTALASLTAPSAGQSAQQYTGAPGTGMPGGIPSMPGPYGGPPAYMGSPAYAGSPTEASQSSLESDKLLTLLGIG